MIACSSRTGQARYRGTSSGSRKVYLQDWLSEPSVSRAESTTHVWKNSASSAHAPLFNRQLHATAA